MARLPSDRYLIQQVGENVIVFEDHTERQIAHFDPSDPASVADGVLAICDSELSEDDKYGAVFFAGYFYAHATHA